MEGETEDYVESGFLEALFTLCALADVSGVCMLASPVRAPALLQTDRARETPDDQPSSVAACGGPPGEHQRGDTDMPVNRM